MKRAVGVLACGLALLLVSVVAIAQEAPFMLGRTTVTAPGWFRQEPDTNAHMAFRAPDRGATDSYRACTIDKDILPPRPGMSQEIVNANFQRDPDDFFARPSITQIGGERTAQMVMVDDVAVADIVARRDDPPYYAHLRLFILVEPDGSGSHYNVTCGIWTQPTDQQVAEITAVMNSLRIAGLTQ